MLPEAASLSQGVGPIQTITCTSRLNFQQVNHRDCVAQAVLNAAQKTPVAEGGPSVSDGGTVGTGSWGGRGDMGGFSAEKLSGA